MSEFTFSQTLNTLTLTSEATADNHAITKSQAETFTNNAINNLLGEGVNENLDTLKEISLALNDNNDVTGSIVSQITGTNDRIDTLLATDAGGIESGRVVALETRADDLVKFDTNGNEITDEALGAGRVTNLETKTVNTAARADTLETRADALYVNDAVNGESGKVYDLEVRADTLETRADALYVNDPVNGESGRVVDLETRADDLVKFDTNGVEITDEALGPGRVTNLETRADDLVKFDTNGVEITDEALGAGRVTNLETKTVNTAARADTLETRADALYVNDAVNGESGKVYDLETRADTLETRADALYVNDPVNGESGRVVDLETRADDLVKFDTNGVEITDEALGPGRVTKLETRADDLTSRTTAVENNKLNKENGVATGLNVTDLEGTAKDLTIESAIATNLTVNSMSNLASVHINPVSYLYIGDSWRIKAKVDGSQLQFEWTSTPNPANPALATWMTAIPFISTPV